ncbi:AzlC family ABC transporter permease [Geoalkalibacter halelectricus]|uniref:AzlC family ABC transporter permease n=1 Tax=Geoalkalibacter halelectricus TaxID=2847045 RepID=A0ABY5ZT22_9BACT|nr:AzlC family ABC transporter permease [Geoalkalibacter halelectricus]MDO3380105.1 AzlC family ABC transporter permease [Geoalkalibacter halelectricus]UWZ80376.1 AzlC family ABC transporter permease [Geoalkalibacter halelectricus]
MTAPTSHEKNRPHLQQGAVAGWPICLGYFPIGLALGVLAQQAGIPWWAMAMMSILVFAGSAQFICVAMLTAGASAPAIILTTFVINLRHVLMSSALAVYLRGVARGFLALFAYGITDESFAVNHTRFRDGAWDRWKALIVNQLANTVWIFATVCGVLVGQFVPPGALGIDYALTAMFICLLAMQLQGGIYLLTALIAGALAVAWYILLPGDTYIVGASVSAATIGFFLKRSLRRGA